MADIKLDENYFFTPEINITSMSNKMKMKDDAIYTMGKSPSVVTNYNKITYNYSLKYIEIPLTFKFRTNENNGMRYWGQIGIAPGIAVDVITTFLSPVPDSSK